MQIFIYISALVSQGFVTRQRRFSVLGCQNPVHIQIPLGLKFSFLFCILDVEMTFQIISLPPQKTKCVYKIILH